MSRMHPSWRAPIRPGLIIKNFFCGGQRKRLEEVMVFLPNRRSIWLLKQEPIPIYCWLHFQRSESYELLLSRELEMRSISSETSLRKDKDAQGSAGTLLFWLP